MGLIFDAIKQLMLTFLGIIMSLCLYSIFLGVESYTHRKSLQMRGLGDWNLLQNYRLGEVESQKKQVDHESIVIII